MKFTSIICVVLIYFLRSLTFSYLHSYRSQRVLPKISLKFFHRPLLANLHPNPSNGPFACHPAVLQHLNTSFVSIYENITFQNDLEYGEGREAYCSYEECWQGALNLRNATFQVYRVSSLSNSRVIMNWNLSFIPESISGLVSLGSALPGCRLAFYNVLDKERQTSSFSWKALARFFFTALKTGELRLPIAVILGSTEFTVQRNATAAVCVQRHEENTLLARSINQQIAKNRKLTIDLLEFLDALRPADRDINEWNELIQRKVQYRDIRGMRQFDVDGLEGAQQTRALELSSQVLGYATGAVLLLSLCFGAAVADKVLRDRQRFLPSSASTSASISSSARSRGSGYGSTNRQRTPMQQSRDTQEQLYLEHAE